MSQADQPPRIEISGLNKSYLTKKKQQIFALEDVSLNIYSGEFVALVGPSGCGKTTLLKILAGLVNSYKGKVLLDGMPVTKPIPKIGFVFQDPTLLPWRNVLENILLPVELQKLDMMEYRMRALELMEMVGLAGFEYKYPDELSGGMRQRAGICRALIRDPEVLLMDEPFGALDAMTRESLNLQIQRIWMEKKKTVIFVTHSIPEAVFLASKVVIMTSRPGKIAEVIPIEKIPRPRQLIDMNSLAAGEYITHIRQHFNSACMID
ncbi:MAG: ABC transporter ATP-binding protein [Saezia sp.]